MPTWYFYNNAGSTRSDDVNNWWSTYNGTLNGGNGTGTGIHPSQAIATTGGLLNGAATGGNSFVILGNAVMTVTWWPSNGTTPTITGTTGDSWTNYGTVVCVGLDNVTFKIVNITLHNYGTFVVAGGGMSWDSFVLITPAFTNHAHFINHDGATSVFGGYFLNGNIDATSTCEFQANSVAVTVNDDVYGINSLQSLFGSTRVVISTQVKLISANAGPIDPAWIVNAHGGTYGPNYPDPYSVGQGVYYGDDLYGYQWGQMPDYSWRYNDLLNQTYNLRFPDPSNIINGDYYVDLYGTYNWGYGQQTIDYTVLTPIQEANLHDLYAAVSIALPGVTTALGLESPLSSEVDENCLRRRSRRRERSWGGGHDAGRVGAPALFLSSMLADHVGLESFGSALPLESGVLQQAGRIASQRQSLDSTGHAIAGHLVLLMGV